jgi:hypothetical protein
VQSLVPVPGLRAKMSGRVFKKSDWRRASVVAYWNGRFTAPLCLVSDLPPDWGLIELYRRRYPIEALFRNYKSSGWHWEQGQVKDLDHLERLLTWIVWMMGAQVAREILNIPATGQRHA